MLDTLDDSDVEGVELLEDDAVVDGDDVTVVVADDDTDVVIDVVIVVVSLELTELDTVVL